MHTKTAVAIYVFRAQSSYSISIDIRVSLRKVTLIRTFIQEVRVLIREGHNNSRV